MQKHLFVGLPGLNGDRDYVVISPEYLPSFLGELRKLSGRLLGWTWCSDNCLRISYALPSIGRHLS